jgi:hypothetical protein
VRKIPLATRFTTIEIADVKISREFVKKVIDKMGNHSKNLSIAFDRELLDGEFVWCWNTKG